MLPLKRRLHVITFRLADDEYRALNQACADSQVRSISEFAREAVLDKVRVRAAAQPLLSQDLNALTENLSSLYHDLNTVQSRIGRVLGVNGKELNAKDLNGHSEH
jgi:uncharacterized protein (DUF1778 family)